MKTRIMTILICIVFANTATRAEEVFPLSGARWTWEIRYYYEDPYNVSYVLQGDTVVDDIQRAKLYYIHHDNHTDSLLMGFIHTRGDSVFYRSLSDLVGHYPNILCLEPHQDYLLYDFSSSKGDSIKDYCHYEDSYFPVLDVDSVKFGGIHRKRIRFREDDYDYWIEGMGSINGLFYGVEAIPIGMMSRRLVCFTLNDEPVYFNPTYSSECPVPGVVSVIRETKNNLLTIFPNPAKSTVTVQSDHPLKRLQIYDVNGTLLSEQSCNNELQTKIQKLPKKAGKYVLKITLQNGVVHTEKLIIP
ncbi:MAG: T9SS type A sorting domain-containing protein [Bacteroidales bacterium]|jgi:hypothetical protein|nr:T9SS type A sorting domain-containing protein [Bacteroidales bacterium]